MTTFDKKVALILGTFTVIATLLMGGIENRDAAHLEQQHENHATE